MESGKLEELKVSGNDISINDITAIKTSNGIYEVKSGSVNFLEKDFEYTSVEVFTSALLGLIANDYTGVVSVRTHQADKTIYIHQGQIVFATSSLIDDRLGEVIYRRGLITLDQMTEASVKVTRKLKFGRVMIESNIFNCIDLWDGLKLQVLCIVQSIFLEKELLYKITREYIDPPTAVSFEESTDSLVKKYASVGSAYQIFREELTPDDTMSFISDFSGVADDNTYLSDVTEVLKGDNTISGFISNRKLNESYAILDVFDLCHEGFISLKQSREIKLNLKRQGRNSAVKSLIDAYQLISKEVNDYFVLNKSQFPIEELRRFLRKQYLESGCLLYVEDNLKLNDGSLVQIIGVSEKYNFACEMIESDLKALIYFVLQILGDIGPGSEAWKLKQKLSALVV